MNFKLFSQKTRLAQAISQATIAAALMGISHFALAEVTFDDGTGDTLSGSMVIDAARGLTRGANLLHTFAAFNVQAGETANFTGPDVIDNIIARVTGTGVTTIDGTLLSSIATADLFILNPNGVMVGSGADINVDGGLYLSSANSLTFADGSQLLVSESGASGFTAAAPSAFGFGVAPADISFDGVSITTPQTAPDVYGEAPFDSLMLAGGDFTISNSDVLLAGKDIQLVSLGGAASVSLEGDNANLVGAATLGNITISNDVDPVEIADFQTSGDPAGQITIVGNRLSMSRANLFSDSLGSNKGEGIQITLADSLVLTRGSRITTDTLGDGDGSDITISAPTISLDGDFTRIASNVPGSGGDGGSLTISASDITLSNYAEFSSASRDNGNSGSITVNTGTLTLESGAKISTVTFGSGNSGSILVNATGDIALAGQDTGLLSSSSFFFSGDAGSITLNAQDLRLTDEATILSESLAFLGGAPGDVSINVNSLSVEGLAVISTANSSDFVPGGSISISANSLLVTGTESTNAVSRISSATDGAAGGGSIDVTADSIAVTAGGAIEVSTTGTGAAGSVSLTGSLTVSGGRIDAQTLLDGDGGQIAITGDLVLNNGGEILSSAPNTEMEGGDAGDISVAGGSLNVVGVGSQIASSTAGGGDAGNIAIASTAVSLENGGAIDTSTASLESYAGAAGQISFSGTSLNISGAGSNVSSLSKGPGNAGSVSVTAAAINIGNAGVINTNTETSGPAGRISLAAADISVTGSGTTISSTTGGNATGGDISLTATNNIAINDNSIVTVTATGDGDAGSISLNAGHNLDLLDGGSVITSAALSGGGNVDVMVTDRIYLRSGTITASSDGPVAGADGGIIQIDPIFLILDRSSIVARAVQGNGGFINLEAQNFVRDTNSIISATSDFGNDGEVVISSPDNSVTGVIGVLPASFAKDDALLTEPCAARALETRSSLVIEKTIGSTDAPDDYTVSRTLSCSPN